MALTQSEFDRWWTELNAEFPAYQKTADDLAAVARSWYHDLRWQSVAALQEASRQWRRENAKRPHLSDMMKLCGTFHSRENAKQGRERQWTDTNLCPCGCHGPRWALYLPHSHTTRDKMACTKAGSDPVPREQGRFIGNDTRGVPVWAIADIHPDDIATLLAQTWP